jgi:hypothetical protein
MSFNFNEGDKSEREMYGGWFFGLKMKSWHVFIIIPKGIHEGYSLVSP